MKRARSESRLPISTLRTYNSLPQPYVLVCSLPEYVLCHWRSTACVPFATKACINFFKYEFYSALTKVYYFIHSINEYVLSTQLQRGHHRGCRDLYDCLSSQITCSQAKRTVNLSERQIWTETHFLPSLASCTERWLSSAENKLVASPGLRRLSLSNKATSLTGEHPLLHNPIDVPWPLTLTQTPLSAREWHGACRHPHLA